MKVLGVGEFKTKFSEVLKSVRAGKVVGIAYGKSKEVVPQLIPGNKKRQKRRKIGLLDKKSKVVFSKDFKVTIEE